MTVNDRFASRIDSLDELPEVFRRALLPCVQTGNGIRLMVHGPSFEGTQSPATVIGVTKSKWLVATQQEPENVTVQECNFEDTLLIELASVLLHGQLKIDFIVGSEPRSVLLEFNTVMEKLYLQAIRMILNEIVQAVEPSAPPAIPIDTLKGWPLKFHNLSTQHLLEGRRLWAATCWPAIYGGFNRELSPAAALLLTDGELVLISEEREQAGFSRPNRSKFGAVITYFPLVRLAQFHIGRHERFNVLSLEVHAKHGGEKLEIMLPPEREQTVAQIMQQAIDSDVFHKGSEL